MLHPRHVGWVVEMENIPMFMTLRQRLHHQSAQDTYVIQSWLCEG